MKSILIPCLVLLLLISFTKAEYDEDFAREVYYVALLADWGTQRVISDNCGPASKILMQNLKMEVLHAWGNERQVNNITSIILKRDHNKMIYVGFSGTKNSIQLVNEIISANGVDYDLHSEVEGAKVMKYFYDKYTIDFRVDLMNNLRDSMKKYPGYDVVFTGHSLGGAMAVQSIADFTLLNLGEDRKIYGYTYGQPRVGNYKFMDAFLPKLEGFYRVVHDKDIVPHVPPCIVDVKFKCKKEGLLPYFYPYHSPQEIWYDHQWTGYTTCDMDKGEDPQWSDKGINDSMKDHMAYFGIEDILEFIGAKK